MSEITIDSEKIAEVRNALKVIQLSVEPMSSSCMPENRTWIQEIIDTTIKEVKRIDKLLPDVKFEGGK